MVRKRGFEPPRSCDRQPLKLVRLPFRHFRDRGLLRVAGQIGWCVCLARHVQGVRSDVSDVTTPTTDSHESSS